MLVFKRIIYVLTILLFSTSCVRDIDFNGKKEKQVIVVNGLFSPDSVVSVRITKSIFFLDNEKTPEYVTNAQVETIINGIKSEELVYTSNGYYSGRVFPKEGDNILLQIRIPDNDLITASGTVPKKIPLALQDTLSWISTSFFSPGSKKFGILTSYNNPEGENFYRVSLKRYLVNDGGRDTAVVSNYFNIDAFSVNQGTVIENMMNTSESRFMFFTQKNKPGEITLPVSFWSGVRDTIYIRDNKTEEKVPIRMDSVAIYFESIDKNYYEYCRTYKDQMDNSGGILADPTAVYSNVEGGTGIVGGRIRTVIGVKIKDPSK